MIMNQKNLFRIFLVQALQSNSGFSIIGVLVSISMGMLVMLGLSSMLSNMNTDVTELKKVANQIDLATQVTSLFSSDCQGSLLKSIKDDPLANLQELHKGGAGSTNTDPIKFSGLKTEDGTVILDTSDATKKEKIKRQYGIEGYSRFYLRCEDKDSGNPDCDCSSGPYPCRKDWSLSLFTMSYNKAYKEILKQGLKITYTGSTESDFRCNFIGSTVKKSNNTLLVTNTNITGSNNSFFGYNAGTANRTGDNNSFFGSNTGKTNTTGSNNSFFGCVAGENNTVGDNNSFFGHISGRQNTEGDNNSFFGRNAGQNTTTGSNNSFFGFNAGTATATQSNRLNIGNVIYGTVSVADNNSYPSSQGIDIHGKLRVCNSTCKEVETEQPSSREYKKNIVPFNQEQKALSTLLKTPLFTYQYKKEHPTKQRTGIISEELPKALQLPAKAGEPIQPDWISIYGYLWAGIKALHKELLDFKELVFKELESLKPLFQTKIQALEKDIKKELQSAQAENQSLKKRFEAFEKENPLIIELPEDKTKDMNKQIAQLKNQADLFQEELKKMKEQIQN